MIGHCIAMKRAYKLQEFVAHTSNVNCLKIGRKSSGVLVTGGEDKKVNMWAIGKPTAILVRPVTMVSCLCLLCTRQHQVQQMHAEGLHMSAWPGNVCSRVLLRCHRKDWPVL